MKHVLNILKISLLVSFIIVLLESTFSGFNYHRLLDYEVWAITFFYSFVLTAVNISFFWFFSKKVGWQKGGIQKVLIASAGSIVLTIFGFFFCRLVHLVIIRESFTVQEFIRQESISFYFFPLLITIIVSLFFHLIYFYRVVQEQKVKEQKILAGTASAQFDALKNQLDPHFLFNSLNVLSSLIEENPNQAQKFTSSLSKVYRYVLEQKDKELVSLEEELAFAVTYMNLLKMRFEGSLFYLIPQRPANPEAKIVPLALQLLLENTVKHNIISEKKPLHIRIFEEDGYLVVENDLQKKEVLKSRDGVGLKNIENRYALITSRRIFVEQEEKVFKVKLPLLTKQITVMEKIKFNEEKSYLKAQKRVKEMKEFYSNLLSYCVVIPFLIFINYKTYWHFQWFWFPLFGWGLGLAIHGFSVFGYGSQWEERKIREIMEKEEQRKASWK